MRHIAKVTALLEYTAHFSIHTHEATISALSYIIFFPLDEKKSFFPYLPRGTRRRGVLLVGSLDEEPREDFDDIAATILKVPPALSPVTCFIAFMMAAIGQRRHFSRFLTKNAFTDENACSMGFMPYSCSFMAEGTEPYMWACEF